MRRLRGLVTFVGGFVLIVLGIGMWRSPEINWEGFLDAWSLVINDVARVSTRSLCRVRSRGADNRGIDSTSWALASCARVSYR